MEIRDMRRTAWRRVKQKEQIILPCSCGNVQGKVSLLKIREVSEPFSAVFNGERIMLAERNYSWLQLAMENDFAWFTVMFDDSDRFLQVYVDLTCGNLTDRDNPVFEDLYLDYVLCEGQVKEMDADELESVTGGEDLCLKDYACVVTFETDTKDSDGYDYLCVASWHCNTAFMHTTPGDGYEGEGKWNNRQCACWSDYACMIVNRHPCSIGATEG
jgi:predicted RNA-binding protein associated with RNAse of E/G family